MNIYIWQQEGQISKGILKLSVSIANRMSGCEKERPSTVACYTPRIPAVVPSSYVTVCRLSRAGTSAPSLLLQCVWLSLAKLRDGLRTLAACLAQWQCDVNLHIELSAAKQMMLNDDVTLWPLEVIRGCVCDFKLTGWQSHRLSQMII